MVPWINMGDWPNWLNVERVEQKYRASSRGDVRYIGTFCVRTATGWSDRPVEAFWQEKPLEAHYSNYFGIFRSEGVVKITDARSIASGVWTAMMSEKSREVVFSRYRHDFRRTLDDAVFVDGGRDYGRFGGNGVLRLIKVVGPHLEVIDPEQLSDESRKILMDEG